MSDAQEKAAADGARRLSDALREVKNAAADRDDVVVELREATRIRLELLATELEPAFREVPDDMDMFDFAISSGLQPRLWIDAVAFVAMGNDRRTYRFVRDTRLGRVVLAESPSIEPIADQVIRYVAERIVERERMMAGDAQPVLAAPEYQAPEPQLSPEAQVAPEAQLIQEAQRPQEAQLPQEPEQSPARSGRLRRFFLGLGAALAGILVGVLVAGALFRDQIAARFGF